MGDGHKFRTCYGIDLRRRLTKNRQRSAHVRAQIQARETHTTTKRTLMEWTLQK